MGAAGEVERSGLGGHAAVCDLAERSRDLVLADRAPEKRGQLLAFEATRFDTVAWPTGEIGGMGLEGAVNLGFKKDLDACETEAPART